MSLSCSRCLHRRGATVRRARRAMRSMRVLLWRPRMSSRESARDERERAMFFLSIFFTERSMQYNATPVSVRLYYLGHVRHRARHGIRGRLVRRLDYSVSCLRGGGGRHKSLAGAACAGRRGRRLGRGGELPLAPADWARVLVVQPRRDAHEVEVVRALRKKKEERRGVSALSGRKKKIGEIGVLRAAAHPSPNDGRVVARPGGTRRTAVERHVADAANVVLGRPCPGGHSVPVLDLHLHGVNRMRSGRETRRRRTACDGGGDGG